MAIHIASYGWDHPGWSGDFYPDDLPPEWRLGYYFNEFSHLAVPAAQWAEGPVPWTQECDGRARLHLELPAWAVAQPERCAAQLAAFPDPACIAGLFIRGADERGLERLAQVLSGWALQGVLERPPATASALAGVTCSWPTPDGWRHRGTGPRLMIWRGPVLDLRRLRRELEGLEGRGLLLFEGTPPDLSGARAAHTLADLMGIAQS